MMDIRDLISGASFSINPASVSTRISESVALAASDAYKGLSIAFDTGSSVSRLLASPQLALATSFASRVDSSSALTALSEMRKPYECLINSPVAAPFQGAISGLATVAGIAGAVRSIDATRPFAAGSLSFEAIGRLGASYTPLSSAAIGGYSSAVLTQYLAPSYLNSAATVFSLESSYARLSSSGPAAMSMLPSGYGTYGSLTTLRSGLLDMAFSARMAFESLSVRPASFLAASLPLARTPALEIYTASQVAAAVTLSVDASPDVDNELEEGISETTSSFVSDLRSLDPTLVALYEGALAAAESGGPDWQRQSMVSLRELTTHVLHSLAPDREVTPWAQPSHYDKGKLTRRARLEFIFSEVAGGEFTQFFDADLRAALELFDLLNSGTHRLSSKATPQQLHYLRVRIAGLLSAMIRARPLSR